MSQVQPARAAHETVALDDAVVPRLLAAEDPESLEQLAEWLKTHARTFAPVVAEAAQRPSGLSPEAASAVLDGLSWRVQAEEDTTLKLMETCLSVICRELTKSLGGDASERIGEREDALVHSAVAALTADRRSRHSETAVRCLADEGPGGALVLARAFDAVRGGLKLYILRHLSPADVLELEDNVVASLAHSVSKFAETLEPPKKGVATRFLAGLGPVHEMEHAEIGTNELLRVGDAVFHARWGAGTVVASSDESATIDFGSAGTRTLLRAFTTLRRAE